MIIPVKCVTCGKLIGHKYKIFLDKTNDGKSTSLTIEYFNDSVKPEKTVIGKTLDELGLTDPCCRRHFMGHVDVL
jgi:DNA-directed RNA polymerase subunit N (RpoN/RPB10)|tara:strand:- start:81 stop:305 length:225 start_codon:yes stop_codon:yes gene_type:complete